MSTAEVVSQGTDLETFRAETRAWLEENCPASMRTPMPEEETVWGGRNATFKNPRIETLARAHGQPGLDRSPPGPRPTAAVAFPPMKTKSSSRNSGASRPGPR